MAGFNINPFDYLAATYRDTSPLPFLKQAFLKYETLV